MKPKFIFEKKHIKSITRRSGKGSYGKLIDILYDKITVLNQYTNSRGLKYLKREPACFTFHGDHHSAIESKDGKKLIIEKIFV